MAVELRMPALSPTMEQGTLARWLVREGDVVKTGDLLAEVETDKATMELEAMADGRVLKLVVAGGTDDVVVGTVIALLAEEGRPASGDPVAQPAADALAEAAASQPTTVAERPEPAALPRPDPAQPPVLADGVDATPLARRIAAVKGITLTEVEGTGLRGRITMADLGLGRYSTSFGDPAPAITAATAAMVQPAEGAQDGTGRPSALPGTAPQRLADRQPAVRQFHLAARCNLDAAFALRSELNADLEARGIRISLSDMLIKASALALDDVPETNVRHRDDGPSRRGRVDISVTMALDGRALAAVIRNVGRSSLSTIAATRKALAQRVDVGMLGPEDADDGAPSIVNLGMSGVEVMCPVIRPPQTLSLGFGGGFEQPWKVDGELRLATIMMATAVFDHRAIDETTGARFMQAIRDLIENPLRLLC